jgi:hypothetical protein
MAARHTASVPAGQGRERRLEHRPYPVGQLLGNFLSDIVRTPLVYKKLIGMQMLLEGLAMGAFANLHGLHA